MDTFTIKLPLKISANESYAGMHFTKRARLKQDISIIVRSQTKYQTPNMYKVIFNFFWQKNVPDADNNYLLAKMILDIISGGNDGWQACRGVEYTSDRSYEGFDYVTISVQSLI